MNKLTLCIAEDVHEA